MHDRIPPWLACHVVRAASRERPLRVGTGPQGERQGAASGAARARGPGAVSAASWEGVPKPRNIGSTLRDFGMLPGPAVGASWAFLCPSWAVWGARLGRIGAVLGSSRAVLGRSREPLGPSWGSVGCTTRPTATSASPPAAATGRRSAPPRRCPSTPSTSSGPWRISRARGPST
eukprot:6258899-Pyramimonas_sp.AAC.1